MSDIGVIGYGRMGRPIAGHLARHGHAVTVHDVTDAARAEAEEAGIAWAESLAEVCSSSEFLLVCVGFDTELREILQGDGGALRLLRPGSMVAVLSTVMPETVEELARAGQERGISVVDATVCRGSWFADEGTLLTFIGGTSEEFARLEPVAACYSSDVVHSGGVGTSQVCKAANNLILWACLVANHEGLALADRYGVDIEVLRQALLTSSATNGSLSLWGRQTMAWADDDMDIVAKMAQRVGIGLPQAGLNKEICRIMMPNRYDLTKYGAA